MLLNSQFNQLETLIMRQLAKVFDKKNMYIIMMQKKSKIILFCLSKTQKILDPMVD